MKVYGSARCQTAHTFEELVVVGAGKQTTVTSWLSGVHGDARWAPSLGGPSSLVVVPDKTSDVQHFVSLQVRMLIE
jgi:hypothetical protein